MYRSICIYKCYLAYTAIFGYCFRHIQTYASIAEERTHAYSELWHIPITKYIQNPRHVHNTVSNIFTKAPSWTFNTVLNAPLFYRCYLTSRVTLPCP